MAIQTVKQFVDTKTSIDTVDDFKSRQKSKITPVGEFLATRPEPKRTLGQKIGGIGKEVLKGLVSPIATTVARPFQAGAELLGASAEDVDRISKAISRGLIAPVPQGPGDVLKDIGRVIETGALAAPFTKPASAFLRGASLGGRSAFGAVEGGAFGLGAGLEEGGSARDVLKTTALVGGLGAVLPVVGAGIGKALGRGKVTPRVTEAVLPKAEKAAVTEAAIPTVTPSVVTPKIPKKIIKETPAQVKSIARRTKILDEDPIFTPTVGSHEKQIRLFDEMRLSTKIDDLQDAILGVKGKVLPDGLTPQAALKLLREEAALNPKKFTQAQRVRLTNQQPLSQAGFNLGSVNVTKGEIKNNPYDLIDEANLNLTELLKTKGITKKSVIRLLDDIPICTI